MILRNLIELRNSIEACRDEVYRLKKNKGKSDPNVLEISQILDEKIIKMQEIIDNINSSQNLCIIPKFNI
jgi:hypothetical protein